MDLVLLIGASGSGKSSWTQRASAPAVVCSADDWFLRDGVYRFDPRKLGAAHSECQAKAREAMGRKAPLVVIDNTNTTLRDMDPYLLMAKRFGYRVSFQVFRREQRPEVLAERNRHGVPIDTIRAQLSRIASMLADWPTGLPAYEIADAD